MKQFVDQVKITVKGGKGGDGAVSFRREKYINKGGPDGGDGGSGGDVYLVADTNVATLLDFQTKRLFVGEDGERGGRKKMAGASGEDVEIAVPVGTLVYDNSEKFKVQNAKLSIENSEFGMRNEEEEGARLVADLRTNGQRVLVARGGAGGKGNTRFRSSTNRVPRESTPGEPGEERIIQLDLKLMADVGLIGFPNAGKSTLLSVLTNARPEIAGYRFTTLVPNLGVLYVHGKDIVIADIPGLIEGAAEGKGLGDDFLRHVERTRVLVHLIDPTSAAQELAMPVSLDIVKKAYHTIREELGDYSEKLLEKPELVIITKVDIVENAALVAEAQAYFQKEGVAVTSISAATHQGLDSLTQEMTKLVDSAPAVEFEPEDIIPVFTIEDLRR